MHEPGKLYIVATPIGNLSDMTDRAKQVLSDCELVAAEDTRRAKQLLSHFNINADVISCHEHNENKRIELIRSKLDSGLDVSLISDAGTPLISDPGYVVVKKLRELDYQVVPVPGACALIAALSVSGLATDAFSFHGFLPAKRGARSAQLADLMQRHETLIFYESTHRIVDFLSDVNDIDCERKLVLARELTKTFETILSGSANEIVLAMEKDSNQKRGEFVVMVQGNAQQTSTMTNEHKVWLKAISEHLPISKASQVVAKVAGLKKKEVYDYAQSLKDSM
jgi:16S rRNA (cytidine1402-2'-O)-methyltransferase